MTGWGENGGTQDMEKSHWQAHWREPPEKSPLGILTSCYFGGDFLPGVSRLFPKLCDVCRP